MFAPQLTAIKKGFTLNMNPYSFSRMSDLKTATIYR